MHAQHSTQHSTAQHYLEHKLASSEVSFVIVKIQETRVNKLRVCVLAHGRIWLVEEQNQQNELKRHNIHKRRHQIYAIMRMWKMHAVYHVHVPVPVFVMNCDCFLDVRRRKKRRETVRKRNSKSSKFESVTIDGLMDWLIDWTISW